MFREKLHKDLDGISPSGELLSRVSQMMTEEAQKPKQPVYMNAVKWCGMAAAVCLIAVGAVAFTGNKNIPETASADTADEAVYSAEDISPAKDKAEGDVYENAGESVDEGAVVQDGGAKYYMEAEAEACSEEYADDISAEAYNLDNGAMLCELPPENSGLTVAIYLSGSEITLSEDENAEILKLAESYIAENSYTMLDLLLSDTETEKYKENGLYIAITAENGDKYMVLADENSSYIFYKYDFYALDGESKEQFLKYCE